MQKAVHNPQAHKKNKNGVIHDDDNMQRQHITRHHSTYHMEAEVVDIQQASRSIPRHFTVSTSLSEQKDFSFSDRFDPASVNTNGYTRQTSEENGFAKQPSDNEGDDSGLQLDASQLDAHDSSSGDDTSPFTESGGSGGSPKNPSDKGGSVGTLLPPLSEPVPSDWKVLEGEFVGIVITYMSHLSQDVISWPNREFDEGCLSIQFTDGASTRKNLLALMEAFNDGSHIEKELVQVRYCRALRLEPYSDTGILTIDGEKIEYGTVQAEVIPNLKGRILTPPRRT